MPSPGLRWRFFLVSKSGHAPDECEDAIGGDPETGRFAVADGASESYAAGEWARHLVSGFVREGGTDDWLTGSRNAWQDEVGGGVLSWYAEDKLARGAHATFLGLTIRTAADGFEWEAIAVGDACLFMIARDSRPVAFPVTHSSGFTSAPALVTSRGAWPGWKIERGTMGSGDIILLATDALAQCLLASSEDGSFAAPTLLDLEEEDDFALWVALARDQGRLKNDDVAMGVVEIVE